MIVVTGANGLLGNAIVQALQLNATPVVGLRRHNSILPTNEQKNIEWRVADILDIGSLQEVLEGATTVIHAAALVSFKAGDGERLYRVNVEGTRNVVNACLKLGVKRLVHISSVAALGRQKGAFEINENSSWIESNLNSEYAESKYLAELEVFRGREEGLQIDIVNPSVILAQAHWNRSSAQLFKYVWSNKPFYTSGNINYVDVRDVVKIITSLLNEESKGGRTIANGGAVPMKEILHQIAIRFNKKPPWIGIPAPLLTIAARLEIIRSRLTGTTPIVSPQSARSANEKFYYSNQKAVKNLNMAFRSLDETLDWCCPYYLKSATINN